MKNNRTNLIFSFILNSSIRRQNIDSTIEMTIIL